MPGGGLLTIRDGEPASLPDPLTLEGTIDEETGAITGASLETSPVSFVQHISSPIDGDVHITATFTQTDPGTATGTLDGAGNLSIDVDIDVDLHIEVYPTGAPNPLIVADCRPEDPVTLELRTTSAYTWPPLGQPLETRPVTVADPNFAISAIDTTDPRCHPALPEPINEQLQGEGHAISLTVEGELPRIAPPDCETATALVAAPPAGVRLGDEVTLDATVTADGVPGDCDGDPTDGNPNPTGFVQFRDGSTLIATAPLQGDGTAQITTTKLPTGTRQLTATYSGDAEFYPSTSPATAYPVVPTPTIAADLPTHFTKDGAPTELTVTATNPSAGSPIHNARLDITMATTYPLGASEQLTLDQVDVEVKNDAGAWVPVTLTDTAGTLRGSLGPATGFALGAGTTVDREVRIAVTTPIRASTVRVAFDLAVVDPGTGVQSATAATESGEVFVVADGRVPSTVQLFTYSGLPLRPGYSEQLDVLVSGPTTSKPGGTVQFLLDGQPLPLRNGVAPGQSEPTLEKQLAAGGGGIAVQMDLPVDIAPGQHTLVAVYSGDGSFLPGHSDPVAIEVLPSRGTSYECRSIEDGNIFGVQVNAQAILPATRAPGSVPLGNFEVTMYSDNGVSVGPMLFFEEDTIEFVFGPGGTGSADTATYTYGTPEGLPDSWTAFTGEQGSAELTGAPGDVVPVTLERFTISGTNTTFGLLSTFACTPKVDPILLGNVTVAGTSLVVDAPVPVRADDDVTLTATVAPTPSSGSGSVEFFGGPEGTTSLGIALVEEGVASITTTLPAGSHQVRARFNGGLVAPSTTSATELVVVLPALDCAEHAVAGEGAVVRLTYMELLGRCPDAPGFAYWTGQLAGGRSPASFARAISGSDEALGMVVDDAYQTMLGRDAEPAGKAHWIGRLRTSGRYDRLLADLAASPEFWTKAGSTNEGFVTRLYDRLLHRSPDPAGLAHWTERLADGVSRKTVTRSFANLDEPLGALVRDSYQEILARDPLAGERAEGIAFLRATGDRSGLYAELIGTEEFTTRAQTNPNPED
ncbi:MAG TPA: Ig-like domain repeat protein [Acidimicrobiales bacterium]|nr:Ig-like domain repeat protein [Acidimicrobiales bacterium]